MNFNQKASIYEQISISQKIAADYLYSMMDIKHGQKILDVGCGTGYLTSLLSNDTDTCGIDVSHKMVETAKELRPNIPFYVFDAEQINEESKYDWIVTNAVTYYFKDLNAIFRKFYNALKIRGKYALQAQTEVTPQFLKAMSYLLEDNLTKDYYSNFRLQINQPNINEMLLILINTGFLIKKAEMVNYQMEYSIEEAFNIFKSGTATPFLNQASYGRELSQEYINRFWEVVYDGLITQSIDNKIILDVPRCFIIAERVN